MNSNSNLPFVPGTALAECDRCGDWKYLNQLKAEYTGLRTCKRCFDVEHPAERVQVKKERNRVTFTRLPQEFEVSACNIHNSVGVVGIGVAGCMVVGRDNYYG